MRCARAPALALCAQLGIVRAQRAHVAGRGRLGLVQRAAVGGERGRDALMETDVARSISLTLADSNYRVVLAGKVDNGTYTLDRTTAPYRMTIIGTEGPNAGKTMLAIFDMPDSQTMRICYDMQGINFPESFESASGSNLFFVTYSKQP